MDDIVRIFDTENVEELAKLAGLPNDINIEKFGEDIRVAACVYLANKNRLIGDDFRRVVKGLWRATVAAGRGDDQTAYALVQKLRELPPDVRRYIISASPAGQTLPDPESVRCPETRQDSVNQLQSILITGYETVDGRKRPDGHRSKSRVPVFRVRLKGRQQRSTDMAGRLFVRWLEQAYWEAALIKPPLTCHFDTPGPYARFVRRCFAVLGVPTGNVTKLLNERGAERRPGKPL